MEYKSGSRCELFASLKGRKHIITHLGREDPWRGTPLITICFFHLISLLLNTMAMGAGWPSPSLSARDRLPKLVAVLYLNSLFTEPHQTSKGRLAEFQSLFIGWIWGVLFAFKIATDRYLTADKQITEFFYIRLGYRMHGWKDASVGQLGGWVCIIVILVGWKVEWGLHRVE